MNRRPPGSKTPARRGKALSSGTAVEGFLQDKTAEGLSPRTIRYYRHDLQLWQEYEGEINLSRITATARHPVSELPPNCIPAAPLHGWERPRPVGLFPLGS